ncbi:hypothetical protein [Deinococcus aluminii]|uniref:YgiT-type zinc finger protein n=1 Tax=Deinococcus aluminii TaxID=1656885 RepID=A0ABP9XEU5_9DEIO
MSASLSRCPQCFGEGTQLVDASLTYLDHETGALEVEVAPNEEPCPTCHHLGTVTLKRRVQLMLASDRYRTGRR